MSRQHDIYNPPPAPMPFRPPRERLSFTAGDVACLAVLCVVLFAASILCWRAEPTMAALTAVGGSLIVLESWVTALSLLQRRHPLGLRARWTVFVAALVPWLFGLAAAAMLMIGLFYLSDWMS